MPKRRPRAGAPLARRAVDQWPLLVAVLATLVVCATFVGVGTLLLTTGQHRALSAAIAQADGTEGSGSADLVTATMTIERPEEGAPEDTQALLAGVTETMRDAVLPYASTASVWAASPLMYLPGQDVGRGYLLDADSAAHHADITAGRWPESTATGEPTEVAIPANVAAALGLDLGSQLRMTVTPVHADEAPPEGVDVVVVGLVAVDGSSDWDRDVLGGVGINPNVDRLPAFGPFLVSPGTLIDADSAVGRVSIVIDPDLAGDPQELTRVVNAVDGLSTTLVGQLGARGESMAVRSGLAQMVSDTHADQATTASILATVLLLVFALGAATLGLVGSLLVQRRSPEAALYADRGASRAQLVGRAAIESVALAAIATALAVPLSLLAYRALAALPPLASAWSGATVGDSPGVTGILVVAVAVGSFTPAAAVVVVAMRGRVVRGQRRLIGAVARSGADLLLVGVAVLGFLQVRAHGVGTGSIDPILVVAPVLCIVAGAALALRILPGVAKVAEIRARRDKGVVLALSGWQVARGRATSGMFLVLLAAATATFGVVFLGTWETSQRDQADAALGADLVVGAAGSPGMATEIAAATGGTVMPVSSRAITLGARPGGADLLALDTRNASTVIRGRLPGDQTWSALTEGLAPDDPVAALTVHTDESSSLHVVIQGDIEGTQTVGKVDVPARLTITPTVVVEDAWGSRTAIEGWPLLADGEPHDVAIPAEGQEPLPAGEWSVVAIDLRLSLTVVGGLRPEYNGLMSTLVTIDVVGADPTSGAWTAIEIGQESPVKPLTIANEGTTITSQIGASIFNLGWSDGRVMFMGYTPAKTVPVLVTDDLASELDLQPGDQLSMGVGTQSVAVTVEGTVPYAPGTGGEAALVADVDAVSRARLAQGDLTPLTDAWWVADPRDGSEAAIEAAGILPVETREHYAEQLLGGPLRVGLRSALALLLVAAVVLSMAGTAARAAASAPSRAIAAARLRGLGVPRRTVLATGYLEHAVVTGIAVLGGGLLGALLAWQVGPSMVTGEGGRAAVPAVVAAWNGGSLAVVLLVLFVGGFAAGVPAVRSLVARATILSLRMGEVS